MNICVYELRGTCKHPHSDTHMLCTHRHSLYVHAPTGDATHAYYCYCHISWFLWGNCMSPVIYYDSIWSHCVCLGMHSRTSTHISILHVKVSSASNVQEAEIIQICGVWILATFKGLTFWVPESTYNLHMKHIWLPDNHHTCGHRSPGLTLRHFLIHPVLPMWGRAPQLPINIAESPAAQACADSPYWLLYTRALLRFSPTVSLFIWIPCGSTKPLLIFQTLDSCRCH